MMTTTNSIFDELNNMFTEATKDDLRSDVIETEVGYQVLTDIPGATKEDIKIEVKNNNLIIKVEKSNKETKGVNYLRHERQYDYATKVISLHDIDPEAVKAKYQDGVLSIDLNKKEKKETHIIIE